MKNEHFLELQPIVAELPYLHQCLDDDFIREQCESGIKCHVIERLDNPDTSLDMRRHLQTLEKRLAELADVIGYDRLCPLLRRASDWDEYQEFLSQIDTTLFLKRTNLLREIEPQLPHRVGNADAVLSFLQKDVYWEVTSFQSIAKAIKSKPKGEEAKIQKMLERQSWKTKQDVEHEIRMDRVARNLLDKTKRQLPPKHPGILAMDINKSAVFDLDIRKIAQRLFPRRPQLALIMEWSWERPAHNMLDLDRWSKDVPDFCYVNPASDFREVGETLLKHLGLNSEVIGV